MNNIFELVYFSNTHFKMITQRMDRLYFRGIDVYIFLN